mmetsp:Transcript_20912/g.35016  ORF Transcript_20912/g.35016 Transcript_20912/m.35016 type:complete len:293 (+) Transcript_20912:129-1007(+)|eukprot:CAMPEP_0198207896 /NCGR_PEP_ID=MMETSP1445-20131203/11309_1 /TAXON_ID=36898 /ORGANISM="Pyramimonas sp., Strain CCMP2087" /LENGTH=292 /DNA_ID=CAMNT_0043881079 /DNA_START=127 /DNA_END=1005 /DNA_ORIENTATION=+
MSDPNNDQIVENDFAQFSKDGGTLSEDEIKNAALAYLKLKQKLHLVFIFAAVLLGILILALFGCMFVAIELSKDLKVSGGQLETTGGATVTVGKVISVATLSEITTLETRSLAQVEHLLFPVKFAGYTAPAMAHVQVGKSIKYDTNVITFFGEKAGEMIKVDDAIVTFESAELGGIFPLTDASKSRTNLKAINKQGCEARGMLFCDTSIVPNTKGPGTLFCTTASDCAAFVAADSAAVSTRPAESETCSVVCTMATMNTHGGGLSEMVGVKVCEEKECVLRGEYLATTTTVV